MDIITIWILGFIIGILTTLAIEAFIILFVVKKLNKIIEKDEQKIEAASQSDNFLDPSSHAKKQGVIWLLNPEKIPKSKTIDKVPKDNKKQKEIVEVSPVRIFAKIKDNLLILAHADGTLREIQLKSCTVAAVSASKLSTRKWAKRYPIKVESETSVIYDGSKTIYIYLETSWEKESWCKTLRMASCSDTEELKWFSELNLDFESYLATLNTGYPLFMKPFAVLDNDHMDRSSKLDNSSKVRHYFKKLSRKMSKNSTDFKLSGVLQSGREEKKIGDKWSSLQDSLIAIGAAKTAPTGKTNSSSVEGKTVPSSVPASASGSGYHSALLSDAECEEKIGGDEGTFCWNLLVSRLFFDVKRNAAIKSNIHSKIQRTLSNMKIPSYMGEVTCTSVDLGSLPPYLSGMRVLPSDMKEVWALEIDFQYLGGVVFHVETRLDVCETDLKEGKVVTNTALNSADEVASDILEGFEVLGKELELAESTSEAPKQKDDTESESDGMRTSESNRKASPASKWKSYINSVAKQFSQVPLSLAIKVASLKGTMRLHIKPPPCDQIWFGFTSMPEIDFDLESFVGERKINSGRIALFLISRFKAAIRETLVLPNCESVCVSWMLAEKDDWVPCQAAPFMWRPNHNQEINHHESSIPAASSTMDSIIAPFVINTEILSQAIKNDKGNKVEDLKTPLLTVNDDDSESTRSHCDGGREEESDRGKYLQSSSSRSSTELGEDGQPKKMGTKARMLGLRKKMGEKLEEKRRVIEERGRHMVEKMKGPENKN